MSSNHVTSATDCGHESMLPVLRSVVAAELALSGGDKSPSTPTRRRHLRRHRHRHLHQQQHQQQTQDADQNIQLPVQRQPHPQQMIDRLPLVPPYLTISSSQSNSRALSRFRKAVRILIIIINCVSRQTIKAHSDHHTPTSLPRQSEPRTRRSTVKLRDLLKPHQPTYGDDRLTFDVASYRARRQLMVDDDIRRILSLEPSRRTVDQLNELIDLMCRDIRVFREFPVHMQRSLVAVATYAFYETDRVIIRQGHRAENFYLILSGKVVVTRVLPSGDTIRESFITVLGEGNSFGEIALMSGGGRNATLVCNSDVELLQVGRDDFIDIFMHVNDSDSTRTEPDFISFLRTVDVLRGWPIDLLPYDKPRICMAVYFRRGQLICRDIVDDEWIYIIKSGTCNVLRCINEHELSHRQHESRRFHCVRHRHQQLPALPVLNHTSQLILSNSRSRDVSTDNTPHRRYGQWQNCGEPADDVTSPTSDDVTTPVFAYIRRLTTGDTFGLECVTMESDSVCPSTSLVSFGAEVVVISRRFFQQHLSLDMWKKLLYTIQQYPSNESLQSQLRTSSQWTDYKTSVVASLRRQSRLRNFTLRQST